MITIFAVNKNKISATNSKKLGSEEAQKNLLPTYYVESDFFQSVFGGNTIEVNPQGSVLVKMGMLYQKVDNPQLSERNRSSFTFDFDQEISASIQAKVGTRLKVGAQYDTQSTFNFQNQIKLDSIKILSGSSSVKYGLSCTVLNGLAQEKYKYVNIAYDARDPIVTYFILKNIDLKNVSTIYFGLDPWIYTKRYYIRHFFRRYRNG